MFASLCGVPRPLLWLSACFLLLFAIATPCAMAQLDGAPGAPIGDIEMPEEVSPQEGIAPVQEGGTSYAEDVEDKTGWSAWVYVLIVAAVFIVPISLGYWLAGVWRMQEHGWKLALVLFSLTASVVITALGWPPKLGIDLRGGVILVYELDRENLEPGQEVNMAEMVAAVTRRINPDGLKEVVVRPYGVAQIEIIIPNATQAELERIKKMISSQGALEFRITANQLDHAEIIQLAQQPRFSRVKNVTRSDGEIVAKWMPVFPKSQDEYRNSPAYVTRVNARDMVEVLVVEDPFNVTGTYLTAATSSLGPQGHAVHFQFDARGAKRFGGLTGANLPDEGQGFYRNLAIILDNQLFSSPRINSRIDDNGEISGNFTQEESEDLAGVLTAGRLPAALQKEPSSSLLIGPTLGQDTIDKGLRAMAISTIAVAVFMVIYYRFAGIVAIIALTLNILLILALMMSVKAAFTLSGLAGLALTVGMAVDANVLIYERIREERTRGATLRMAIRNGFARATTTIVDANVTTLITAFVLYFIGTDQIKGFAITLGLGLLMNLFTAVFCSRVMFDVAEKLHALKELKMMKLLDNTNFDFIGKRHLAVAFSSIVILIGLAAVGVRGAGLLDIDFTGGVSVETQFEEPIGINDVRMAVEKRIADLPDVTVANVAAEGEERNVRYIINTSRSDVTEVEKILQDIFADKLAFNHLAIEDIEPIAETPKANEQSALTPTRERRQDLPDESVLALAFQDDTADDAIASDASGDSETIEEPKSPEASKKAAVKTREDDAVAKEKQTPAAPKKSDVAKKADAKQADAKQADAKQADEDATTAVVPADDTPPGDTSANDAASDATPATGSTSTSTTTAETAATDAANTQVSGFSGGTQATLKFSAPMTHAQLMSELQELFDAEQQEVAVELENPAYTPGSETPYDQWTIRLASAPAEAQPFLNKLRTQLAAEPFFPSSNTIGATVAGHTQAQAFWAFACSLGLILIYVWFRFSQIMFGVAAIVAVVHDVLVTLGALAISLWLAPYFGFALVEPFKISLPIVAAFLTIIGYSLNDTIVIFDRIREIRGKSPDVTPALVNLSINQTLGRTILTSVTVFIVVLILYIWGGAGVHAFAFALVVGTIAGTYSTIFIATPLLVWLNKSKIEDAPRAARGKKVSAA